MNGPREPVGLAPEEGSSRSARVLVTGAGGFVGSRLVKRLTQTGHAVRGLYRTLEAVPAASRGGPPASWRSAQAGRVAGDLSRRDSLDSALDGADTVVHLAARTGKAAPAEYVAVNVEGTRTLLSAAVDAGVDRFLFVSSVAARFPAKPDYPYARSKAAAEALVEQGGPRFTIVRPAVVVGPGSGPLLGLEKLAALPVVPLLGGGGTLIQPVWVDDLVELMAGVVERDRFDGETVEVGGPETVPIGEFLVRIRRRHGRSSRTLRLPAAPILAALTVAERVVGPLLPVTAGQLASFVHDGSTRIHALVEEARGEWLSVDEMLEASGVGGRRAPRDD